MRDKLFRFLARLATRHPGKVMIGCVVVTVAMMFAAGRLSFKTQIADMMPKDIPAIKEFMDIIDDYESADNIMITIESSEKDVELMRKAADDIAPRIKSIVMHKPVDDRKLSFRQKIAISQGKYPVEGVEYETKPLVRRIEYKIDKDFISKHGMMIQKTSDLENMTDLFGSLELTDLIRNINDNFEKEYIEDSDNLSTLDGEGEAVQGLESMLRFVQSIDAYIDNPDSSVAAQGMADFVSGPAYYIAPDNSMLMIMVQPAVSFTEFEDAIYMGERIVDTLEMAREMYPELTFGRTGGIMYQLDENDALGKDFGWPSVIALALILALLIGSFRTWKNPFYSVITLICALIWVTGILALTMHYLNMMSAGFSIVLIGLGIDFGIHFISGFRDGREQGKSAEDSIFYMYHRVGAGVMTGALTTAIVFFSLPVTGFQAYAQMGYTMGTGIVVTLITMMIMLPALIVWDNKGYCATGNFLRKVGLGKVATAWKSVTQFFATLFRALFGWMANLFQFGWLATSGRLLTKTPVAIAVIIVSAALVWLSIESGRKMEWEYDMMKLYPQETPSAVAQDKILDKFEIMADNAMVRARDLEHCRELVEAFKKAGNKTGLIGQVDGISEFIPTNEMQEANAEIIKEFKSDISSLPFPTATMTAAQAEDLEKEFVRLHQNIVEIGELSIMGSGEKNKIIRKCDQIVGKKDEDSYVLALARKVKSKASHPGAVGGYQAIAGRVLKDKLLAMANTERMTIEKLPQDIRKRYINPNNNELLVTVFSKGYIWEERVMKKFNATVAKIDERTTGMIPIMELLMAMMGEKGRIAMIAGSIAIIVFLLLDFRSVKYTILAAIPLAMGVVWMVGLMALAGMKLSMMNFMALPLIIGIGIDDGVHILHRYRIEGPGSIPIVLKYTGRAILLTSLTTMIGFGSMGLASHLGMASLGKTLFFGVGACFVSSAFVLPAVITIWEKWLNGKR